MNRQRSILLVWLPAVFMFWTSCRPGSPAEWESIDSAIHMSFPTVDMISPDELSALLAGEKEKRPLLLDVREQEEYEVSHLRGAHSAPNLKSARRAIGDARDTSIVVYCSVGFRSVELAEKLQARGYERVRNLQGSIFRWANEGRPLLRGEDQVDKVHPYEEPWSQLLAEELRYESY